MKTRRVMLAWSGGKDSAWALHVLRRMSDVEVAGLFTTVDEAGERIAVHAVSTELLARQARSARLPLETIALPQPASNEQYERALQDFALRTRHRGVTHLAFGDLFLQDIRSYRERQFSASGLEVMFPLWGLATPTLARDMTAAGLKAWIACVDSTQAPREWAGRCFDQDFVRDVPSGIDPCGENGEFHTFVFEGPMLAAAVPCRPAGVVDRGRFVYCDIAFA